MKRLIDLVPGDKVADPRKGKGYRVVAKVKKMPGGLVRVYWERPASAAKKLIKYDKYLQAPGSVVFPVVESTVRETMTALLEGLVPVKSSEVDTDTTKIVRSWKTKSLKARYQPGDFTGAVKSAVRHVRKHKATAYVYKGNSYGHLVYRVALKKGEAFNPINNSGTSVYEISPDEEVTIHYLDR